VATRDGAYTGLQTDRQTDSETSYRELETSRERAERGGRSIPRSNAATRRRRTADNQYNTALHAATVRQESINIITMIVTIDECNSVAIAGQ